MSSLSFTVGSGNRNRPIIPNYGNKNIPPGNRLVDSIKRAAGETVTNIAKDVASDFIKNRGKKSGPKKPGNGKKRGNKSPDSNARSPISGSKKVTTTKVSWSSDVKSGLVFNPQQDTTTYHMPLILAAGEFLPNLGNANANAEFDELMRNYIYPMYLDLVLNHNYRLARYFDYSDFIDYFNVLNKALQMYYTVDSVLAYCSDANNQNVGMRHLRSKLSVDILSLHSEMEDRLLTFIMPKPFVEYIRYMYQNFTFGNTNDCPIVKLNYKDSFMSTSAEAINTLSIESYSALLQEMTRVAPIKSYLKAGFKDNPSFFYDEMPKSDTLIYYDAQFCTLWHNLNVAYVRGKDISYSTTVDRPESNIYYGSFAAEPDGVIYASCSITEKVKANKEVLQFESDQIIQHTGLWAPYDNLLNNEPNGQSSLLGYSQGIIKSIQSEAHRVSSHLHSAPIFQNPGWINKRYGYAGCQVAQVHSVENLQQAVSQTAKTLLAI